jgi:threonylcarbamoyladenosine tRNA methylthiotransferase MtaB
MNKKVAFYTLGCKLNYSETSSIGRLFTQAGFDTVEFSDTPDVYVINTCSVTENADKKCKKIVKEALKISPNAFNHCRLLRAAKTKRNCRNTRRGYGFGRCREVPAGRVYYRPHQEPQSVVYNQPVTEANEFVPSYSFGDRTRTFLKVQDGCDYSCTFCTIPLARGSSRSDTIENAVAQAKEIAASGVKEIVLTGVNLGDFGIRNGNREDKFFDLVKALDEVEGIERIRISSIEPNLLK